MNWKNIKLGDVIKHRKGSITIDDDQEYKLCRVQLHRRGVVLREIIKGSVIRTKKQQVCKAGDFLVAEMDAKLGGYGFVPNELDGAIVSSHYFLFELDESKINPKYLEVVSQLQILQEQIKAVGSTNHAAIRPSNVLNWEIPITTIEHQNKIVQLYETTKDKGNLLTSELTHQQTLVKQLRQQLLQEAVQGKLVENDANTEGGYETAHNLLKKIKAEKEQLIKEKKIKKDKELPPIKPEEIPFDIPEDWVWCRLGEIFRFIDYRGKTPTRVSNGVRLISAKNIRFGYIDDNPVEYISGAEYKKWMVRGFPQNGDILFVTEGHTMGFVATIDLDFKYVLAQRTICLQPPFYDYSKFIFYSLMSPNIQNIIKNMATGAAAMGVKSAKLKELLIPLPPLSTQHQIVAKVDSLMQLCDSLEASIAASARENEALLQQVLREALRPA